MSIVPFQFQSDTRARDRLGYHLRVLRVIASVDFKLKYLDSALGYVWSLAKPVSYFLVIWALLGGLFKGGVTIERYPLYLFIGIVLYGWFVESTGMTMSSITGRSGLLRRVYFPRIVVPLAATATAGVTFLVNVVVVAAFIAVSRITPDLSWLLLVPLVLEVYLVILGLGLLLTTLYVQFRDIGQVWDLAAQLLLFAMPVMYSITVMPYRVQKLLILNPVAQVMGDVRYIILGPTRYPETIGGIYGSEWWHLVPIGLAIGLFAVGYALFQRRAPYFAERV